MLRGKLLRQLYSPGNAAWRCVRSTVAARTGGVCRPSPADSVLLTMSNLLPLCHPQTVDLQKELVRVQKLASFNAIDIQASCSTHAGSLHTHVLDEDETPVASPSAFVVDATGTSGYRCAAVAGCYWLPFYIVCSYAGLTEHVLTFLVPAAALKGGDGYDRLLEFRCGRYLFHHGKGTFLPVPALPADFGTTLHGVAGSRNIKGACGRDSGCSGVGTFQAEWGWKQAVRRQALEVCGQSSVCTACLCNTTPNRQPTVCPVQASRLFNS